MLTNTKEKPIMALAQPAAERPADIGAVLLTPGELAAKLNVPPSWIREKTRARGRTRDKDPLPVVRLGKYVRFRWNDIETWLARQGA